MIRLPRLLAAAALLTASACSRSNQEHADQAWLFATRSTGSGFELAALDPIHPGALAPRVEPAGPEFASFSPLDLHEVRVDAAGGQRTVRLVYARLVGDHYQLFTVAAGRDGTPRAVRSSTLAVPAADFRGVDFHDDALSPGAGAFVVSIDLGGGNLRHVLVDYAAGPAAAPIELPPRAQGQRVLGPLRDAAGVITGWVVADDTSVHVLDARWRPASYRIAGACQGCGRLWAASDARGGMWLEGSTGTPWTNFLKYLPADGLVSDPGGVATDVTGLTAGTSDDRWLYWIVGRDVFRAALGGGAPERISTLPSSMNGPWRPIAGVDRLVFEYAGGIYSIPKAGVDQDPTLLYQGAWDAGYRVAAVVLGGTVVVEDRVAGTVRLVAEDGSAPVDLPAAGDAATSARASCRGAPSWSAASAQCLVALRWPDGSCTAWSYDAASRAPIARLGEVAECTPDLVLASGGSGTSGLIAGLGGADGLAPNLFLADLRREGSLVALPVAGVPLSLGGPTP